MKMVLTEEYLTMKYILTALKLNIFQKKRFIENKNNITNTYRIQAYDSTLCRYFYIGFIDFMLKSKRFLDYTNSFYLKIMKRMI